MPHFEHSIQSSARRELLPEPTLQRLPWYLAYVSRLNSLGVERVSSTQIAKQLNVDSSQIAKDLSFLNIRGKTRIGYDVARLQSALVAFLGFTQEHRAVIIGVGSLGAALLRDSGLMRYGLHIVAGFDIDRAKFGRNFPGTNIPVYDPERMSEMIPELHAEIGIICVPHSEAQTMADAAVAAGVKALWNFTPHRLQSVPGVVIQDTSIYSHLAVMYNRLDNIVSRQIESEQ